MNVSNDYLDQLKALLYMKKSNQYYADKLGITPEEVASLRTELKINRQRDEAETAAYIADLEEKVVNRFEENVKTGTAEATYTLKEPIRTLEELITRCDIDTEVWDVYKYVQNFWGSDINPNYQVKAWMEKKKVCKEDVLAEVIRNFSSSYQPVRKEDIRVNETFLRPCLGYLALTDVHIDKIESTGLSLKDKLEQYKKVLSTLVYRAYSSYYMEEILFVIGHDWFNTDTYYSTTTNGTQQYNNSDWDKAYDAGYEVQVWAINFLLQFCNRLKVAFVPGNHDRTKTYFMVHALEQFFASESRVTFDRTSETTKVHTYGECFIGMHHGDTKIDNLPLYCSNKFYKEWGKCKFKEIGVGDKHHKKTYKLNLEDTEIDGVRLFMTPSLGGFGQWDKTQRYDNSIQAGIIRLYDAERGKCGEMEERI